MRILLVNPPNCGRSIPEEKYGITSLRQIFRGEPLALETLAGALTEHQVEILDLKVEPDSFESRLHAFAPDLVGFTAMTCEAQTVRCLAGSVKNIDPDVAVAVGGIHAGNAPGFFNHPEIDYICLGLGKLSFRELVRQISDGRDAPDIPGVAITRPGRELTFTARHFTSADLLAEYPPRYDLVQDYRSDYVLELRGQRLELGFVASAFGCPYDCNFCCISPLTGGRYLTQDIAATVRDIKRLEKAAVIRLVDANTFGNPRHAAELAEAIKAAGIETHFITDVRSDTVVNHPDLMQQWHAVGLRSVVIGFEEIDDQRLAAMSKASNADLNRRAVEILHDAGITVVGDFIISPSYTHEDFDRLDHYLAESRIDLPILTVMTPLPGTPLYKQISSDICIHDLDYYTLTNAVVPTILPDAEFYKRYAELTVRAHARARL